MLERCGSAIVLIKVLAFFLIFVPALQLQACQDRDTTIDVSMDDTIPPTFSFEGPWWAVDFEVIELSEEEPSAANNYSTNDKTIWKISLANGRRVKAWPKVTYGVIPEGFSQTVPSNGEPPQLIEGKTYAAQALDSSRAGGAVYFVIRNGKPISAPEANLLKATH